MSESLAAEVRCQRKTGRSHERSESTDDFLVKSSSDKLIPRRGEATASERKGRVEEAGLDEKEWNADWLLWIGGAST